MDTKLLKQKILDLAIRGKLVPQDPNDEPASVLLERIRAEKERLVAEGKIKRSKSTTDNRHYENHLFEIPDSWEWVYGFEIFNPMQSTKPEGETFDYIDIDAIDNKCNVIIAPKHLTSADAPSRATRQVSKGDVLFSMVRPYLRNIAKVEKDNYIASTGFYVCKPNKAITSDYCFFLMISNYVVDGLNHFMKGDNSPSINNDSILSWQYPLPPINEQHRITATIEKWFDIIDEIGNNKQDLQKAVAQAKSKILSLAISGKLVPQDPNDEPAIELLKRINPKFIPCDTSHYKNKPFEIPDSWVWVKLGDISDYGKCHNVDVGQIGQDDWVLELEDVEKDTARIIQYKTKSDRTIKGTRHKFTKDCVLYSKLRTYLNKVLVPEKDGFCTTEIIPINFVADINPQYMCFVLRSQYFVDYTNQKGYGVKMPRLSTTDAKNGLVPLPPFDEQKRIVDRVEAIFALLYKINAIL